MYTWLCSAQTVFVPPMVDSPPGTFCDDVTEYVRLLFTCKNNRCNAPHNLIFLQSPNYKHFIDIYIYVGYVTHPEGINDTGRAYCGLVCIFSYLHNNFRHPEYKTVCIFHRGFLGGCRKNCVYYCIFVLWFQYFILLYYYKI